MIRKRKILAYSLCAILGLLSTSIAANATCAASPAGKWHFFAMQGQTPDIHSVNAIVKNGSNQNTTIKVFPNTGEAFQNNTSNVIKCTLTVNGSGNFTNSPCSYFAVTQEKSGTAVVSGNIALSPQSTDFSSCNLTGTINVADELTPVTIQGGHINGSSGAGIATQGTKQVLYFTLVKN